MLYLHRLNTYYLLTEKIGADAILRVNLVTKSNACSFADNDVDDKSANQCIKVNLHSHEYHFLKNDAILENTGD